MPETAGYIRKTTIKAEDEGAFFHFEGKGIMDKWSPSLSLEGNAQRVLHIGALNKIDDINSEAGFVADPSANYLFGCGLQSTCCVTTLIDVNALVLAGGFPDNAQMMMQERSSPWAVTIFETADPATKFLRAEMENIINAYEQLPVSYNQVMIRGALRYCSKLLDKISDISEKLADELIEKVRKFTMLASNLRKQIEAFTTFAHLDLTYVENIFESIEEETARLGYMPKLEDMPL